MTVQEVIKKFMKSLDTTTLEGEKALDKAVQSCSDFSSIQDAINQMVSTCKSVNNSSTFLERYCGINLSNTDTGAITGYDAGGSEIKTAESIVPESGSLKTRTSNSFSTNGLTLKLVKFNDDDYENHFSSTTYSSLTDAQKYIWNALYTWWIPNCLDLLEESYGSNFSFNSSSTVDTMHVGFVTESNNTLALVASWTDGETTVDLDLKTNMTYYGEIDTSDKNGSSSSTSLYLDRTLAHELTHAVMSANIKYFSSLPLFIKEGMAELTHGIDDVRTSTIKKLAGSADSLKSALDLNNTSDTTVTAYAGGYMFLRYLAEQASNPKWKISDTTATYGSSAKTLITVKGLKSGTITDDISLKNKTVTLASGITSSSGASVSGGGYTFKLSGSGKLFNIGKAATLKGSSGKDTLVGGKYADKILGYDDNDSLNGGKGNDSLYGGAGADTLIGSYGKDYLSGGSGNDSLYGGAGADTLTGGNGNDYLNGGSGNDSLYGGAGADTLTGGNGKDYLSGGSGNDSLYGGTSADTLIGGNGKDYLSGGSGNDSLYGGANADTLTGGKGDDTLTGGYGKDIFIYSKNTGNDVITDYSAGNDKIKISSGSISKTTYSGNDVIFKIGSGTLTVKNGNGKKITINDTTKKYSNSLLAENNFVTSDNLDLIIQNNSVGLLEENKISSFENLVSTNNLITYSEK